MLESGTTTISEGQRAISKLIQDVSRNNFNLNEAHTRFHIIDRIIVECLGWPRASLHLEQCVGRAYSDYELGMPKRSIWEAKRM